MEFYADESVVECEMPEIIVCYKESSYQSVKDICIDERVPSQGKIWVQTKEVGKDPESPVDLSCNIDSDLDKGSEISELPILGRLKSSTDSNSQLGFANVSAKMYEINGDRELVESSNEIARPIPLSEPSESADSASVNESYLSPDMDSGSVSMVTNSVIPRKEEKTPSADEKPNSPSAEGTAGNTTYLTLRQNFLGETSFSSGVCPPSSITYLDPIGYMGNISLRSESNTGSSTRSFAFPTLQPEWYGSPVRMRKAGHKRYQKLRGWLQAVICCRV